eukprot:TRINITY_DN1472_c0_g1_i1.p2 TRINITY_DN1472_c0_g1~~TRINITY_DN1472_c0_g1_i1.p2  ORF type:complete len:290 (-),score=-3.05 TRINITY_DN1472_c0_g1_i1:126-995(-)
MNPPTDPMIDLGTTPFDNDNGPSCLHKYLSHCHMLFCLCFKVLVIILDLATSNGVVITAPMRLATAPKHAFCKISHLFDIECDEFASSLFSVSFVKENFFTRCSKTGSSIAVHAISLNTSAKQPAQNPRKRVFCQTVVTAFFVLLNSPNCRFCFITSNGFLIAIAIVSAMDEERRQRNNVFFLNQLSFLSIFVPSTNNTIIMEIGILQLVYGKECDVYRKGSCDYTGSARVKLHSRSALELPRRSLNTGLDGIQRIEYYFRQKCGCSCCESAFQQFCLGGTKVYSMHTE